MIERVRDTLALLWRELAKFGVIGVLNFAIDLGLYNYLIQGPMAHKSVLAKFVSGAVATVFAWVGNRYWTFRHRRNRPVRHEVALFFVVNGAALLLTTGWVAFAKYGLGVGAHDRLWLNVHAIIGTAIGTVFRFWTYHSFVFAEEPDVGLPATSEYAGGQPADRPQTVV